MSALFSNPSLVIAGILLGACFYVFFILNIMIRIVDFVSNSERRISAKYDTLLEVLTSLTKDKLAVFQVNLTKNTVEYRAGTDFYDWDLLLDKYTELIKRRSYNISTHSISDYGSGLFTREGLLAHFQDGYHSAREIIYTSNKRKKNGYYLMEATLTQQPTTGDIFAFITESDYNKDIINDIMWNKALNEAYDGIAYIADGQLNIVLNSDRENQANLLTFHYKEVAYENFIRKKIENIDTDEDYEYLQDALSLHRIEEELSDKDVYTVDFSFYLEDEIFKRFTFFAVNRESHFYLLMASDLTEIRRDLEEQNEMLEEALEQAEASSEAKTTFLSHMSHDMHTSLNTMISFTNLAKQSVNDQEKTLEYLDKILTTSNHMLSLINDVKQMSSNYSVKKAYVY